MQSFCCGYAYTLKRAKEGIDFYDEIFVKIDGFTIYGKVGSVAYKYAKENRFNFVDISTNKLMKYGDMDLEDIDNEINIRVFYLCVLVILLTLFIIKCIHFKKQRK